MKKRTVIILAIAVVLLLGAYLVVRNWDAIRDRFFPEDISGSYTGDGTSVIFEFDGKDAITRIDWQLEGEDYTISRDEEGDFLCDSDVALDQDKIDSELLEYLHRVLASHELAGVDPADYGLDEPWLTFTVYGTYGADEDAGTPGTETSHTLSVGTYNTTTGTYYVTDGSGMVWLLYNKIPDRFGPYEDFAVADTMPQGSLPERIAVTKNGETYEFYMATNEDGTFYSTVFSWYMLMEDGSKQPVLVDPLDEFYTVFNELSWVGTVEAGAEDLSPYGLDDPVAILTIDYVTQSQQTDDAGNTVAVEQPGSFTLLVGDEMDDQHTYAMREGSGVVQYLLTEDVACLVEDFTADDLLMHAAVVPEWQTIERMDITLPDGTTCTCEIVYAEDDEGEDSYFINGQAVDKETLRSVFTSMFNMDIDGMDETSDLSTDDAVLTVHFTRDRQTYADMTLYLIPYSSSLYVVDFAGEQKYLVTGRVIDGIVEAGDAALATLG